MTWRAVADAAAAALHVGTIAADASTADALLMVVVISMRAARYLGFKV